jgi:ferredoxin-NADP reductase
MEYSVTFIESVKRTPTAVSYRFSRPAGFFFAAGQYLIVDLGDGLRHPLSLSEAPAETGFLEFTKRLTGSAFCDRLQRLVAGGTFKVKGPAGHFTMDGSEQSLVLLVGGIGITPIRSILKSLAGQPSPPAKTILIYGNLNAEDIAFRDELEGLVLPGYRLVHVLADPQGVVGAYQGYITAEIVAAAVADLERATLMVSGPPVMVGAMQKNLAGLGVASGQVRTDIFLGYE